MEYFELRIKPIGNRVEEISNGLVTLGFQEFAVNDPTEFQEMIENLSETEWYDKEQVSEDWMDETGEAYVTLYFGSSKEAKEAEEKISQGLSGLIESIELTSHDDGEWKDKWKEYFYPTKVSKKFFVIPTWWEEDVDTEGLIPIHLDPGMAFGTGTHESTSLTLNLMEEYLEDGMKLLDVGTGSGILAIAAVKLGASEVLGIDIDPDAVETAKENFEGNRVEDKARAVEGDLTQGVDFKADIIVANLLTDLVIRFCPDAARHLEEGKVFISSGILYEKSDGVKKALEESGFEVVETLVQGEWCAIAARRMA